MNAPESAVIQRSFRGVLRDVTEEQGDRLHAALIADIESTHLTDEEISDRTGVAKAQLSRIRHGQAHAPPVLVAWAIEHGRLFYVRAICSAAEGEFKPKPPPGPEEKLAAYLAELEESGLDDHFRARVERRLGRQP